MDQIKIFPSLISSNILTLEKTIAQMEPECDGFHIDIMDNHFVPNLTWGPPIINQIAHRTNKPLAVHLMVKDPKSIIMHLKLKPKSTIAIHCENDRASDLLEYIASQKMKPSIAINPSTPLEKLYPYLKKIDQVLLMSVEPGFSGQAFIASSVERLKQLVSYKTENDLTFDIAMDGGINEHNIHHLYTLGCSTFCIASAIFDAQNPLAALKNLYNKALEG